MRTIFIALAWLVVPAALLAQTTPQFEVASIRPSADQPTVAIGMSFSESQVRLSNMSLRDYLITAYGVVPQQVQGPDWIGAIRFDIAAKIPEGRSRTDVPVMLQALLADRFQLKMHHETRDLPVFALGIARDGLKIQAVGPDNVDPAAPTTITGSGSAAGVSVDLGNGSSFSMGNNRIEARKVTMEGVARMLTRFVDRPVIDDTHVRDRYDLTLAIAAEDYTPLMIRAAVNAGVALPPQAMRLLDGASVDPLSEPLRPMGLTITSKRAPLDVIVVDSIARAPTEN